MDEPTEPSGETATLIASNQGRSAFPSDEDGTSDSTFIALDHVRLATTYEFQYWKPQGIPDVFYETIGLNLFEVSAGVGLRELPLIDTIELGVSYQFTPGNTANQERLIELRTASQTSWRQLAGNFEVGLPFIGSEDLAVSLVSRYTEQNFLIAAQALKDYWYYSQGGVDLLVPGDIISTSLTFSVWDFRPYLTLMDEGRVSWRFGAGFFSQKYIKPYTHEVREGFSRSFIFNSTFSGLGFGGGAEKRFYFYEEGLPFQFIAELYIGPAKILFDDLSIEEYLPEETSIVLTQIKLGARLPVIQFGWLSLGVHLDYDYRSFGELLGTNGEDNETLNSDHVFGVKTALTVKL